MTDAQASGAYASFCCLLWTRADDFMRVAIGTFFVAIYAVGGRVSQRRTLRPNAWT